MPGRWRGVLLEYERDIAVQGHEITLSGRRGRIIIQAPEDTTVRVDALPLHHADGLATPKGDFQHRIAIRKSGTSGVLEVRVRLVG